MMLDDIHEQPFDGEVDMTARACEVLLSQIAAKGDRDALAFFRAAVARGFKELRGPSAAFRFEDLSPSDFEGVKY
jgi:hypothetical protein